MVLEIAKKLYFFAALTFVFCLLGCSSPQEQRVLLLLKTLDNPFFRDIQHGFEESWSSGDIAIDTRAGKNESDAPGQREILDSYLRNFVRNRPKPLVRGLVLTPSDSGDTLVPAIAEFRKAGIPVILVDTAISQDSLNEGKTDYNLLIASNNFLGGEKAAKLILNNLRQKQTPRLVLLNGVPEHDTAKQRRDGFMKEMSGHTIDIRERTANWRRSEARSIIEAFKIAGQVPEAIFAANDEMAIGALEALRDNKTNNIPIIVGFDATNEAIQLINSGDLLGTIAQSPKLMGEQAAKELGNILQNKSASSMKFVPVPVNTITKDTITKVRQ